MNWLSFLFLAVMYFCSPSSMTWAEAYPEYTGVYIECGGKWCDINATNLAEMDLVTDRAKLTITTYVGFFNIHPSYMKLPSGSPRILIYYGKPNVTPDHYALVEMGELPFNNLPIHSINNQRYREGITYSPENVKAKLWTFKREIVLRHKVVEGKVGMHILAPSERLKDGLYLLDSGTPIPGGHKDLASQPDWIINKAAYKKVFGRQGQLIGSPFIIGNVLPASSSQGSRSNVSVQKKEQSISDGSMKKEIDATSTEPEPSQNVASESPQQTENKKQNSLGDKIGGAIGGAINQIFKK
jgi:hypothetical protein